MADISVGPPPGQEGGPLEMSSSAADFQPNSPNQAPRQTISRVVQFPARSTPPPPRPRHLVAVHISAFRAREPLGRTRPLLMTERGLARLVEAAEQIEAAERGEAR
jgi:hypothetical protein